ncbi:S-layer homology domain-containing protein [Altericista sp. CCNU0014]|uniref:S-layer homology domain-containing protein n=1 Tax=Altericista sp. CCNU0014 TaxID=3082949 RepID=UPI00384C9155
MNWLRIILISGIGGLGAILVGCDRASLQRTFSADPKANQWNTSTTTSTAAKVQLPTDFPETVRYPGAVLKATSPLGESPNATPNSASQGYETQWVTSDSRDRVLAFYRERLQQPQWKGFREALGDGVTILSAQLGDRQLSVSVPQASTAASPEPASAAAIEFAIVNQKISDAVGVGPEASPNRGILEVESPDLSRVPVSLQPYVRDVAQLEVIADLTATPDRPISRALFARWLVELNNRIYRDRPARQIRLASASQPAFADVPATHPEFAYIQGLAESGYLPSPLSGDSTQTRFRPSDPLTRETLLWWKVPVDRQQVLPTVSVERVKQVWGFKDTSRIAPAALSAVAADRQNGDLSNIRRVLGSTLLFQPQKPVTRAEAAAALWFIGIEGDSLSARDLLRSERQAQAAAEEASPDAKPTEPVP